MPGIVGAVRTWGAMIKFSHSVFALPFALLATFLAARPQLPTWTQIGLIVFCMAAARSAAMTFNRIIDARFDAANPRTAQRQLPTGAISKAAAWTFFCAACGCFLLGCGGFWLFHDNPWPLRLSLPVLALLCGYSCTKRFTSLSHIVLGSAIALAPVAAWIAITPATLGATAWLLMAGVACWIAGFDLIYACQDAEHDRQAGLYSIPAHLGAATALRLARLLHALAAAALIATGFTAQLGVFYYVGVGCAVLLLIVENSIVHPNDLSRVNLAFFTMNGVVGLLLGGLGVLDICLARV